MKHVLNRLMREPFAGLSLSESISNKFADYRDERLKVVKPGTIRRELGIMRHVFDIAEREWDIRLLLKHTIKSIKYCRDIVMVCISFLSID